MSRTHAPPPLVRNRWWLVIAAGVGVFMAQLDATIVNTALPTLQQRLGTTTGVVSWVMLGYTLPLIALALPSGRWLDRVGPRAALVLTVGGFVAASVLAGLSPAIGPLIAARIAQGAFGAALFALLPVIAASAVDPSRRGRALGVVFTLGPIGGAAGPVLGGLLLDGPGWPWMFLLNVPVGLAVIAITLAQLPRGNGLRVPDRAWFTETALLGSAAVTALLALTLATENGLAWIALLPVAAVPALLWHRSPAGQDVRRMWRAPGVAPPLTALALATGGLVGAQFLAPFFAERSLSFTPAQTGLALLAIPAGMIAGGPLSDGSPIGGTPAAPPCRAPWSARSASP
ncbi:MFS transporter [Phytomonospora endophytica]|uniref:MFS family permease n=1 Tax=Phytomonospora endophytica TaxID=714109 RepID=A0A841FPE2_9ACTN|nr:MFS transporter [Phytomonospora endophytica]MBB6035658.1 MFS family permease [Phytomonospora endophytica]GIG69664.1 hypothetical protein Pen01_59590 [Phytomonospora endophytica]